MTVDRVFVVAGHFNEFRRYCQDSGLNVPRQARFVRDGSSLRGLAGPIEVVWLEGAVERVDFDELRAVVAEINRSEAGIPKAGHRLNNIEPGDRFRINDENFVLTGVLTDVEGCQQLTLARPGSFCHQASETAPPPDEGMLIRGQLPAEIAKTLADQGLPPDVSGDPYAIPPNRIHDEPEGR